MIIWFRRWSLYAQSTVLLQLRLHSHLRISTQCIGLHGRWPFYVRTFFTDMEKMSTDGGIVPEQLVNYWEANVPILLSPKCGFSQCASLAMRDSPRLNVCTNKVYAL
jgi:hypothetical protein